MSQDLWMIFKSKDSQSIMTAACQTLTGGERPATSPTQAVVDGKNTPAKTELGISATAFKNCLWIGYVGSASGTICLARSSNGGQTFDVDMNLGAQFDSEDPPALVVYNDMLWIFWRSKAQGTLHYSTMSDSDPTKAAAPQEMRDHASQATATMLYAPAAVEFQGALWVAYVEHWDSRNIFLARVTDGGSKFEVGMFLSVNGKDISSSTAPALAAWNDRLWMFWRSRGDDSLYFSSVGSWSVDEFTMQEKVKDKEDVALSKAAPAAAVFQGQLCVAYIDTWQGDIKVARSRENASSFQVGIYMGREDISSNRAPALFADVGTSGSIRPRFQLLSILYSPPGSTPASTVTYESGSSAGSTLSIANNTDGSVKVTASVEGGGNGVEASVQQKVSASNSQDLTVIKSETKTWQLSSNDQADGIDHGNDVFRLLLNPEIKLTSGTIGNLTWSLDIGAFADPVDVLLKWIHPTVDTTQPCIQELISRYGFTDAEFSALAECNPFSKSATVDDKRFEYKTSMVYVPGTGVSAGYELGTEKSSSSTTSQSLALTVGCSVSSGFAVAGFDASVKVESEFTWEVSRANTQSSSSSQTASASIGSPSADWAGAHKVYIYLDRIYETLMFSFDQSFAAASVIEAEGELVAS